MNDWNYPFTPEDWQSCMRVLQHLAREPYAVPDLERMKTLVTKVYKQARKLRQQQNRMVDKQLDSAAKAQTQRVQGFRDTTTEPLVPVEGPELKRPQACYVCRQPYTRLHVFYHRLCPDCAAFNFAQRQNNLDLTGRIALVTGGRIKVGLATALRLLRAGAQVMVTSRFPANTATVYAAEPDYADWAGRLQIVGLDFLQLGRLESWIQQLTGTLPHLDILINNAAQTLWRPPDYYEPLQELERRLLPGPVNEPAELTDLPAPIAQEPPDSRDSNSWMLEIEEIPPREWLETQVINAIAPALLCSGLKTLLIRSPFPQRFVINVASAEGQFSYPLKTTTHAHTNMAKAALNMLTRTSAEAFALDGIYMNAVDVGWISPETPEPLSQAKAAKGFVPPLDAIDAAARLLHPVQIALAGEPVWGKLLKNYAVAAW